MVCVKNAIAAAFAAVVFSPAYCFAIGDPDIHPEARPETQAEHIARVCAQTPCRTEIHDINLKTPDGASVQLMSQLFPYDDNGTVILFPGEALELDAAADGMPAMPRFVKLIDHIDKPAGPVPQNGPAPPQGGDAASASGARAKLAVEFKQDSDKPDMLLTFGSELNYAVKYDAIILVPTKEGLKYGRTSSCPVRAGLVGMEHWPFPIAMIVLSNFRVAAGDDLACK